MAFFGYEYFCGANVIVEIEDVPVLEAVGVSVNISESKRPIYGYSSRHFDAVARGQVIVQGSLLVNYVHQDYLFRAIEMGLEDKGLILGKSDREPSAADQLSKTLDPTSGELEAFAHQALDNYGSSSQIVEALKAKFWPAKQVATRVQGTPSPHDSFGGMDLKITFGERTQANQWLGSTSYLVSDVYFTGRGQMIEIDESTIVEEYPFFARNIYTLAQNYQVSEQPVDRATGKLSDDTETVLQVLPAGLLFGE